MMPDLGPYATYVTLAYVVSLGLLAALVALSVWQGKRVKRQLAEAEARRKNG
jgi:heme exporter protein D